MPTDLNDYKKFAERMVYDCGSVIKKYFKKDLNIESKNDMTPVTIADREAEKCMRQQIMKNFPDHGIIGEEFGTHNPDAEYQWTLDPIDGTISFISRTVTFGTLVGLLKDKEPVLGLFYQPILNEMMVGDNKETLLNGKKVQVKPCPALNQAVLLTTDHLHIAEYQNEANFHQLINQVKLYRNWGDCYGYYLLASGFANIMIDPIMSPWDSLPVIPIIRGAGGIITDYQGNDPLKGESIVAAAPQIHSAVIDILNK